MRAIFCALLLILCAVPALAQQSIVQKPGGRLTLVTHTPVMMSPGTNADSQTYTSSTIYYDCYASKWVPVYNGSADVQDSINGCEVSLTMATSSTGVTNASGVFDIGWYGARHNICVVTNGSGGGWASDTATATQTGNTHTTTTVDGLTNVVTAGWWPGMGISESHGDIPGGTTIFAIGADGTSVTLSAAATASHTGGTITVTGATNQSRGFGYSQVHNTRGYWTNVNALTHCYNAATDYGSIPADQWTYLGTLYTTGAGQTKVNFQVSGAGGVIGIIGLWNAYNRETGETAEGDTTTSWTVTSSGFAALDAGASGSGLNNRLQWVDGLQQSSVSVGVQCYVVNASSSDIRVIEAIDWVSGSPVGNGAGGGLQLGAIYLATNTHTPRLGFHYIQFLQQNASGTGTATMFGGISCGGGMTLPM